MDDRALGRHLRARRLVDTPVLTAALDAVDRGEAADLAGWLLERGLVDPADLDPGPAACGQATEVLDATIALAPAGPAGSRFGDEIGRFVEPRMIARGGMGVILEARDLDLDRLVAVKVLPAAGEAAESRFLREARVTGQLEHPNIVPVHEIDRTPDGRRFFTMKLVRGRSLDRVLADIGPDDPIERRLAQRRKLLGDFLKVCDALAYAHSRGIVHRDLKPANVMIGEFGEVLVMDWGIAKVLGEEAEEPAGVGVDSGEYEALPDDGMPRTVEGAILGTPGFMSPEQAAGAVGRVDARSDVYSLGALLYNILTLRPPYEGRTLSEILERQAAGPPVPPSEVDPTGRVPRELDAVVLQAMARSRRLRYASVLELQADVAAHLEGQILSAARYTAWQRVVKWIRRRPVESALAAVASLALVAAAAILVRSMAAERDQMRAREEALDEQKEGLEAEKRDALEEEQARTGRARRLAAYRQLLGSVEPIVEGGFRPLLATAGPDLERLGREFGEFGRGRYVRGLCHDRLFEFDEARAEYRAALASAVASGDLELADLVHYRLGVLAVATDRRAAVGPEFLEHLAAIDPARSIGPHRALACLHRFLQSGEVQGPDFGRAIELRAEAARLCEEGIAAEPTFADLYYWRSVLHVGEVSLGLHAIEERLELQRATWTRATGQKRREWVEAERVLRVCLSLAPGHGRARRSLAIVQLMRGRTTEGIDQLEHLVETVPDSSQLRLDLVQAAIYMGDLERVDRYLLAARARFPERWEFAACHSAVLGRLGRHEAALEASRAALALTSEEPPAIALYRTMILEWLLFSSRFHSLLALDRLDEAAETWDVLVARIRLMASLQGSQIHVFIDIPDGLMRQASQAPSLLSPPALRRPLAEFEQVRAYLALLRSPLLHDQGHLLATGLFGPLEMIPFEFLSFLLFAHGTLGQIDTAALRRLELPIVSASRPGLALDGLYITVLPYVSRLLEEGRLRIDDPATLERMTSMLFLLGDIERAKVTTARHLAVAAEDGAAHLQRALVLAAAGAPPAGVLARLRTARALGAPVADFRDWSVFDDYRSQPGFPEILGE